MQIFSSMRDMQIDWLRTWVAAVDAGSMQAATGLVHRSASAISAQIAKLEAAIGHVLLHRGPRVFELTPAGQQMLLHARRVLAAHDEARDALSGMKLTGRVHLGVPDDYAVAYLTPVLRRFGHLHPAVDVQLTCEQSTRLIPKVQAGELELALISRDRPGRGELLFAEPMVWVASAEHEAWRRNPLPVAAYETGSMARTGALRALKTARRTHRVVYDSASLAGQLAAVQSGLAVAALTACSVPSGLQRLDERHHLPPLPSMQVALLRGKSVRDAAAVDALADTMRRTLMRR